MVNLAKKVFNSLLMILALILSTKSTIGQQKMKSDPHNFSYFSEANLADEDELARFSTSQSHPEYGVLPYNAPCNDCIELVEDRTQYTRKFLRVGKNGKEILTQKGYSPLHYLNDGGQWITYNPKVKKLYAGNYGVKNDFYGIRIDTEVGYISFQNYNQGFKPLIFHKDLALEYLDDKNNVTALTEANWSNYSAGDEGLLIQEIFPNVDLEILVYCEIIKTNFKVKQDIGKFRIREILDPDVLNRITQNSTELEVISLYENGNSAYEIGDIKIFGENQEKREFLQGNYTIDNNKLFYTWDPDKFAHLNYPVIIDPTVTSTNTLPQASITGSGTFANNGNFIQGCTYNLLVPTPANCTVTDIKFSFDYAALTTASLIEGALKFYYGSCESPSPGFLYKCDSLFPGICYGNNISLFTDFQSCIPAPQCTPYNMDFTMEFFDGWGSGNTLNCDPTFIAAASDWTMTITGETVDQPTPPVSSAAGNTICEGASTNLTATPVFGVPPYTYSWNNGGGTGNPVTVSPSTTTNYICTITDSCGQVADNNITITVVPAPDAGTDTSVSFCLADPMTSLLGILGGTPDATGSWTGPSTLAGGSVGDFTPGTTSTGVYTYTVVGVAPCTNISANVTVTITPVPNAGTDGAVAFCPTDASSDLFLQLGGTPDPGGSWAPTMTSGTGMFDPGSDPGGTYTYTAANSCGSISSDVVVTVNPAPNAGTNGAIALCPTDVPSDLFSELGGTPDAGGTWVPALTSGTGIFDPSADVDGTYTYTVSTVCGSISADVVVAVLTNPDPGMNGTVSFCPADAPTDLFNSLGGTPDIGGDWTPTLTSGTGVFDPGSDPEGTYTYSINACGGGGVNTATITVTLNPSPNAGTDGSITLCADDPVSDLFNSLGGTPDVSGTWSPGLNSGTGVFDPSIDAAGTYIYTVTNPCGSISADVNVTVNSCALPVAGFVISDTTVCIGDCITLTDTSANNPTFWDWNFGGAATPNTSTDQNPSICPSTAIGTFVITITATNVYGSDTATMTLKVGAVPSVNILGDTTINVNGSAPLTSLVSPSGGTYSWTHGDDEAIDCNSCIDFVASPTVSTKYTLTYTTSVGCSASDSAYVHVVLVDLIDVPNGFSPNGDGMNDILFVKGEGLKTMNFAIYNRYGQKLFQTDNQSIGWDGSFSGVPENPGVFAWYLEYTLLDGTINLKKGNVTLIK